MPGVRWSAGLARHLGVPVWMIRALFITLTLCGGAGVLLYAWCWVFTPRGRCREGALAPGAGRVDAARPRPRSPRSSCSLTLGNTPGSMLSQPPACSARWEPSCSPPPQDCGDVDRSHRHGPRPAAHDHRAHPLGGTAGRALRGAAGACGRWRRVPARPAAAGWRARGRIRRRSSRSWRELSGERARRIREEQRSEIAAHLHDSVLQTLALIQNRAGASSEAARLARAQERELRGWLFDGDPRPTATWPPTCATSPARSNSTTRCASRWSRWARRPSGERRARRRRPRGDAERRPARRRRGLGLHRGDGAGGRCLRPRPRAGLRPGRRPRRPPRRARVDHRTDARAPAASASVQPGAGGVGTEVHLQLETREPAVAGTSTPAVRHRRRPLDLPLRAARRPRRPRWSSSARPTTSTRHRRHRRRCADVVLLDVHLPGGAGRLAAAGRSCCAARRCAGHAVPRAERLGFRGGRRGRHPCRSPRLHHEGLSGAEVSRAVHAVAGGDAVFSPRLAGFVLDAFGAAAGETADAQRRARPALGARAGGHAPHRPRLRLQGGRGELFISTKTVETHVSAVLRKLQLSSRHELTAWASARKLL